MIKEMREQIDKFKDFLLKESIYDIDSILDKINQFGINSLSFYERKVLENPEIQKKLLYQYKMSLYSVKELLNKFNIKSDNIYIHETFYLDGEIMVGDYDEDKFIEVINKVGKNNYISICRFESIFIKNTNDKPGVVGKMKYTNKLKEQIKCYPISFNFYDDRTELVFYEKSNDEIIEMSRIGDEFGFCSEDEKNKYIQIVKNFITDDEILENVKTELNKIKINDKQN
jgi:hypothetical protein